MVKRFKIMPHTVESFPVDTETVVRVLKRHEPWYRRNRSGDLRYFAVCPKCENPIQLVNVTGQMNPDGPQYGKHESKGIDGFEFFDGDLLRTCPFVTKNANPQKTDRHPLSETSRRIIRIAVENFDHIVRILRKEFGFNFKALASNMLDDWFSARAYNYNGANLENIPWMIAYFSRSTNLYGQFLTDDRLIGAIRSKVPHVANRADGQLLSCPGNGRMDLRFSTLHHRIIPLKGEDVEERLTFIQRAVKPRPSGRGYKARFSI